jgi:glycosyltransferase involved in cell wall biosynthesis
MLSVVMPVRDGAHFLRSSLPALGASDLPKDVWELIVVDDGSGDGSAEVAARHADRVVRIAAPGGGPARARNQGAALARGSVLVFVDADVCVHPDALRRILAILEENPAVTAVFGSYDLAPAAAGTVSQYRNLLHAYVHGREAGDAVTFWTGLGAVRRQAYEQVGRFDETERLDDVELGYRLAAAGHRIVLDPAIQGTHLKRWTLGQVIVTDVRDRGVPWVRLLLDWRGRAPRPTLSIRGRDRVMTALAGAAGAAALVAAGSGDSRWLWISALAITGIVAADYAFLTWLKRARGRGFMIRAIPLRILYYALNVVSLALALVPMRWPRRSPPSGERAVASERATDMAVAKPGGILQ